MQEERYREIFGKDFDRFKEIIGKHQKYSIRANTLKIEADDLKRLLEGEGFVLTPIPWCREGFFVENIKEGAPTRTDFYREGLFFVQNGSSMMPPVVLDPKPDDRVLDMCAAPGAKTTQLAAMMNNEGVIVAAEKVEGRMKALRSNVAKMGAKNVELFIGDVKMLVETGRKFNKILIDAPCTGTGSCEPYLLKRVHKGVKAMAAIQKNLLRAAVDMLEKDGVIVYSTCSMEPEENEGIVDFAIRELGLTPVDIDIDPPRTETIKEWKGTVYHEDVSKSVRISPLEGIEGFFIAKLRRA